MKPPTVEQRDTMAARFLWNLKMKKKTNPTWEGKTNFCPGMPVDLSQIPDLKYQALEGRVYTILRFTDDSVSRGEIPLAQLEDLVGKGMVEEGWYSASGTYLGETLPVPVLGSLTIHFEA